MVTYATSSTFGVSDPRARRADRAGGAAAAEGAWTTPGPRPTCSCPTTTSAPCPSSPAWPSAWASGRRRVILGTLHDDPEADAEIAEWCDIAKVLHDLHRRPDRPLRPRARVDARHAHRPDRPDRGLRLPRRRRPRPTTWCGLYRDGRRRPRSKRQEGRDPRHVRHARPRVPIRSPASSADEDLEMAAAGGRGPGQVRRREAARRAGLLLRGRGGERDSRRW